MAEQAEADAWADAGTVAPAGWRTEVYGEHRRRGRYYMWRTGRGTERRSAYGGKFDALSAERKAAYYQRARVRRRPDIPGRA